MHWLKRWFGFAKAKPIRAVVPGGVRVYAVGDIHGRFDLLEQIVDMIRQDRADAPCDTAVGVFLGDYVDRGPRSRDVVDWLSTGIDVFEKTICLKGNHEVVLEDVLAGDVDILHWRQLGGFQTLVSYGVHTPSSSFEEDIELLLARLRAEFPDRHRAFLASLPYHHEIGDYFFVHAGVRPGVALARQLKEDLTWIREPFLRYQGPFEKLIVHGHTPQKSPEFRNNRINIDTQAFASGVLTCLVLSGGERRLLQTGRRVLG